MFKSNKSASLLIGATQTYRGRVEAAARNPPGDMHWAQKVNKADWRMSYRSFAARPLNDRKLRSVLQAAEMPTPSFNEPRKHLNFGRWVLHCIRTRIIISRNIVQLMKVDSGRGEQERQRESTCIYDQFGFGCCVWLFHSIRSGMEEIRHATPTIAVQTQKSMKYGRKPKKEAAQRTKKKRAVWEMKMQRNCAGIVARGRRAHTLRSQGAFAIRTHTHALVRLIFICITFVWNI